MNDLAFDPNGMIMDVGRSCFTQRMRYVGGDPSRSILAAWYFAKPTAKAFPVAHRFGSSVWDTSRKSYSDLGFDAQAPSIWYAGDPINSSDGTQFAGPQICFEVGQADQPALDRAVDGTPLECLQQPFGAFVGGSSSSDGSPSPTPAIATPCVPEGVPYKVILTIEDLGGAACIAGKYVLYWNGGSWVYSGPYGSCGCNGQFTLIPGGGLGICFIATVGSGGSTAGDNPFGIPQSTSPFKLVYNLTGFFLDSPCSPVFGATVRFTFSAR